MRLNRVATIGMALALTLGGVLWWLGGSPDEPEQEQPGADSSAETGQGRSPAEPDVAGSVGPHKSDLVQGQSGPTPQRAALTAGGITVLDPDGQPVSQVQLIAVPLGEEGGDVLGYLDTVEECDRLFVWSERTERIRRSRVKSTSGEDGECKLDLPGQAAADEPWVLIAAKPGFLTTWEVLSRSDLDLTGRTVRLERASPVEVQVLRGGVPQQGANVELQALLPPDVVPAALGPEDRCRRALTFSATTDERGQVLLPFVPGRCRLSADRGDSLSIPEIGELVGRATLDLEPAFSVFGRVSRLDGLPLNDWTHLCVSAWDADERAWLPLKSVFPNGEGSYQGLSAPVAGKRYRVQALLTGARDVFREFSRPRPGESRRIDFAVPTESALWLTAVDANDDGSPPESIPTAVFEVRWKEYGGRENSHRAPVGGNGYAWLREIPAAAQVWYTASAAGYESLDHGPFQVSEGEPTSHVVELEPVAPCPIRVTLDGAPVQRFQLRSRPAGATGSAVFRPIRADADGRFLLSPSRWPQEVQAWIPQVGASAWTEVPGHDRQSGLEPKETIELQVRSGPKVTGRVVSRESERPIEGASISWRDRGSGQPLPILVETGAEGRFSIPKVGGEVDGELVVRAELHASLSLQSGSVEPLDLGDLRLEPAGKFRLLLDEEFDGHEAGIAVVGHGVLESGRRSFDAHRVLSWTPDSSFVRFEVRLGASDASKYPRDITAKIVNRGGPQSLQYRPPVGEPMLLQVTGLPSSLDSEDIVVAFEDPLGRDPFLREVLVPAGSRQANLPRLRAGPYRVRLSRAGGQSFGADAVQVREDTSRLEVSGNAEDWVLQLLRPDDGPVGDAILFLKSGGAGMGAQTRTNAEGVATTSAAQAPRSVSGRFADGGIFSGVPVQWTQAGTSKGVVEVGDLRTIPVELIGDAGPLANGTVRISDPDLGVELAILRADGSGFAETPPLAAGRYAIGPAGGDFWPSPVVLGGDESRWRIQLFGYGSIDATLLSAQGDVLANRSVGLAHSASGKDQADWVREGWFKAGDFRTDSEGRLSLQGAPAGWIELTVQGEVGAARVQLQSGQVLTGELEVSKD